MKQRINAGYTITDSIHVGRENLDSYGEDRSHHLEVWTRYPESVPCTGNSVGAWPTGMAEGKIHT